MTRPPRDPRNPFDERAIGVAVLCTILLCAASGVGFGVFFEEPAIGGIAGGAAGIVIGSWLVPRLMRDWKD